MEKHLNVYEPITKMHRPRDPNRCAYRINGAHPGDEFQCIRKIAEYIDGYGFCAQHARMVKESA